MTEWSKRPDQSVVHELMSYAARIPPSGSFSATASTGKPQHSHRPCSHSDLVPTSKRLYLFIWKSKHIDAQFCSTSIVAKSASELWLFSGTVPYLVKLIILPPVCNCSLGPSQPKKLIVCYTWPPLTTENRQMKRDEEFYSVLRCEILN